MYRMLAAGVGALALAGAASGAQAANLLVNAGFESGGLSPWAQTADYSSYVSGDWSVTSVGAHSGTYAATDVGNKLIEQDFAGVAASAITEVSFWMRHPGSSSGPAAVFFRYSDASTHEAIVYSSSTDWQFFNVTSFLDTSKTLTGFGIYGCDCGEGLASTTMVDDVMVDGPGGAPGVPEPATWALMIGGFGMAGMALRRRQGALAA